MEKKAYPPPVLDRPGTWQQTFRDGETVLLTVKAAWPLLKGEGPGVRRVNRYCGALAKRWQKRWEGPLLQAARAAAGPDTPPWSAGMDFRVTLLRPDLFSFYLDIWEDTGSPRPRRIRCGEVWSLPDGAPLPLKELLPKGLERRGKLLEELRGQISARVSTGESIFCRDWPRLARSRFSPQRFYLGEEGLFLFYSVCSVAPALEGFPTFLLKN